MNATDTTGNADASGADWRSILRRRLPLFGHRNWIVIADAAYPAQCSPGIETVATGAGFIEVLREVLAALDAASHVRPILHADRELAYVAEADAPGVTAYREELADALRGRKPDVIPHEKILEKLDAAGSMFRVLLLKTDLTIPYTSVFIELDCGYWSVDAEHRLRAALASHSSR
jgi:L-fucose mutarotase/ribose pyranase (RbsD/FucU family)